jgi:hypothetical protein
MSISGRRVRLSQTMSAVPAVTAAGRSHQVGAARLDRNSSRLVMVPANKTMPTRAEEPVP